MGCQTSVDLDRNLTFSITTHDPETGILTDTASPPIYRVYEDEDASPLLIGTMAKLDDANTTGFYVEQIACTAANGFEVGKSYTVYIEATVVGNTGGIAYAFTVTPAAEDLADAILDRTDGIESGVTLREAQRLQLAAAAGKLSGAGTTTVKIRDVNNTTDRITATVDEYGNRTAVATDVT
jgi:hypothetical protein